MIAETVSAFGHRLFRHTETVGVFGHRPFRHMETVAVSLPQAFCHTTVCHTDFQFFSQLSTHGFYVLFLFATDILGAVMNLLRTAMDKATRDSPMASVVFSVVILSYTMV